MRRSHAGRGAARSPSIIAAPKQRNTEGEKAEIKAGRIPEAWADKPAKLAQKDRDARWTVKWSKAKPAADGSPRIDFAVPAFGYKNHVGIVARANRAKSKVRSAVEHVFARQKGPMALVVRTNRNCPGDGQDRLANLVYNMRRAAWLTRQWPTPA